MEERSALFAILVERREAAEKLELVTESLATSVKRKSCANMKVRQVEIVTQEETSMHKMWQEKLEERGWWRRYPRWGPIF